MPPHRPLTSLNHKTISGKNLRRINTYTKYPSGGGGSVCLAIRRLPTQIGNVEVGNVVIEPDKRAPFIPYLPSAMLVQYVPTSR